MSTIISLATSAEKHQLIRIIAWLERKKANRGGITGTTLSGYVESAMTNTRTHTNTANGSLTRGSNSTVKIFSSGGEMRR